MNIVIREATREDFSEWMKMRADLWPSTSTEDHQKELEQFIDDKKFHAYVALYQGNHIGFIEFYLRPFANGCSESPVVFVEGIWVHKAFRRKKIGKALYETMEEWAKDNGHKEIGSDTSLDNNIAQDAHKNWGFKETSRVVYFKKDL